MDYSALAQLLIERILMGDFPFLSEQKGPYLSNSAAQRIKMPAPVSAIEEFFGIEDTSTLTWKDIHKGSMKHFLLNQYGGSNEERLELQLLYARKIITKERVSLCPRTFRILTLDLP